VTFAPPFACVKCGKPPRQVYGSAEWHAANDPIGGYCCCGYGLFEAQQMTEPRKPGRPRLPDSERYSERVEIRCTKAQREKLDRLGGVAWIRERIDRAREPT
jgi:hypothetical protein